MAKIKIRIGEELVNEGILTNEQVEEALAAQKTMPDNPKIGEVLVTLGYVTEEQISITIAKKLGMDYLPLEKYPVASDVVLKIPEHLARKYDIVAVFERGKELMVATADPTNLMAKQEIGAYTRMLITFVIANKSAIEEVIDKTYNEQNTREAIAQVKSEYSDENDKKNQVVSQSDLENAPIIRMINSIIELSFKMIASDIHIEPGEKNTRVRMRVDGKLQEQLTIPMSSHEALITRLKIMADMDIAEKRVPQDGRFEMEVNGEKIDVRVSSMPTVLGEKMVLRILNSRKAPVLAKDNLGMTKGNMEKLERILQLPHGMVLVTGPTGSGKSTTLYTILSELNKITENIITLEDPVERTVTGLNQVQMNNKAGLNFAAALRSVLRQDPDIVMVGEIRDGETATIAIRAAITGHLVFSTLHTNSAIATIMRLVDMGVEGYLVAIAVKAIMAQRLTRCICKECRTSYEASTEEKMILGLNPDAPLTLYKGVGCSVCNKTGYKGRRAVHEILLVNDAIKEIITRGGNEAEIKQQADSQDMKYLSDHMRELVLDGITTIDEFVKITFSID